MSVVPTRKVLDPCPPIIETCTIQTVKRTHYFVIPAHNNSEETRQVIMRSELECAQENSDVADDTLKTTRKCRASNENEACVALGAVDVNAPHKIAQQ